MKLKKFVAIAMVGSMLVCTGCSDSSSGETGSTSEDDVQALKDALAKLEEKSDYIVRTNMDAPDGSTTYLEVVMDGGSYTEYPVSEDGEVIYDESEMSDDTGYSMVDWLDSDGSNWVVQSDDEGYAEYYSLPQTYGNILLSRNVGYFDMMVDNFTSIEKDEETHSGDIGDGEEEFTVYDCKLPSRYVKDIMGVGTYSMYQCYAVDEEAPDNVKTLCNYYMDELDMSLTFSDANVSCAVNSEGVLKQIDMEIGGLGTRMYVTKSFMTENSYETREKPDMSDAKPYYTVMEETADYVAQYDSYQDAMDAMYSSESDSYSEEDYLDDMDVSDTEEIYIDETESLE